MGSSSTAKRLDFVEFLKLRLADYYLLTKPNLSALVVTTTLLGLGLAAEVTLPISLLIGTVLGTAFSSGGACALNMFMESELDRQMPRTAARPLPAGRISDIEAAVVGIGLVALGGLVLWVLANPLTSLIGLLAAAVYIFAYTPMKRVSPWATVVGAIPGALPPLMGYTAVSGTIGLKGLIAFGILFFWQLPHFWALSFMFKSDYERGGFRLWPGENIHRYVIGTTFGLVAVSISLYLVHAAGLIYLAGALLLGSWFVQRAFAFARANTRESARALFFCSIAYLPLLIMALIADRPRLLLVLLGVQ